MSPRALLTLTVLPDRYAICRFDGTAPVPQWAIGDDFVSISRTRDELSIICPERNVPQGTACSGGWRILKCEGPLDYNLMGIFSSLAQPVSDEVDSIFVHSFHDSVYVVILNTLHSYANYVLI